MAQLMKVHQSVYELLKINEKTREDDFILVLEVYRKLVDTQLPFESIMQSHAILGLPSFETIRRTRQRIQAQNPELVNEEIKRKRQRKESEYRAYALHS